MISKASAYLLFLFVLVSVQSQPSNVHTYALLGQPESYTIRIKFSEIKLRLTNDSGRELAIFPVALPRKTPRLPAYGEVGFVIVNPYWYPTEPTRAYYKATRKMDLPKTISPADPRNAMGKAKIGIFFSSGHINRAVVIHGTNDPPSIGNRISRGCIRMYNEDILKLISLIKNKKTLIVFEW